MRDTPRPAPTADLDSPEEIAEMVRRFYADVAMDDLFEHRSEHLPKLTAFWSRALLALPGYAGNPFRAHAEVHHQEPFTPAHFERWLGLFTETVELGWVVHGADRALAIAHQVARVHREHLLGATVDR